MDYAVVHCGRVEIILNDMKGDCFRSYDLATMPFYNLVIDDLAEVLKFLK
jgi:hypothetical protein